MTTAEHLISCPDPADTTADEPSSDHAAWLDHAAQVIRRTILLVHPPSTCVVSTRIGIEVLRYFGIPAAPDPVQLIVYTPNPEQPGTMQATLGNQTSGEVVVTKGPLRDRRLWGGHLILRTTGHQPALLDLSADQFHRPEHNITITKPVTGLLDPDGLAAWLDHQPVYLTEPGQATVYRYTRHQGPGAYAWRREPAWNLDRDDRALVAECIRVLRGTRPTGDQR